MRFLSCPLLLFSLVSWLLGCPTADRAVSDRDHSAPRFTASKEQYDETFKDILGILKKTDTIITTRDFTAWKGILTEEYVSRYSDPVQLKVLSNKPYLKDRNIVLKSLFDYFLYVFIPSRQETKLDKIEFIDKNHVKAITVVNNIPYVVYLFEKDKNNNWKIGLW